MGAGPEVEVEARVDVVDLERWRSIACDTLMAEGIAFGQLDLVFVDESDMAELNAEHMGQQGSTDVLAFPLDGPMVQATAPGSGVHGEPVPVHLGDVVVCPAVAARQAPKHSGSLDAELALLVVHGVLHVLGYDHFERSEAEAMRERERVHLARYDIERPPNPESV